MLVIVEELDSIFMGTSHSICPLQTIGRKQIEQMGMNHATDSYSRNIQNQITNAQK